jgi:hypothetical protein
MIKDGYCTILVFGPFENPRDHVEAMAMQVKKYYTTHKCEWNEYNIKFWII